MSPSESPFARLCQRAGTLYTLPAVAMKVLELTGSDQVDTKSLKKALENDPALCVKLLRVVNSSLFGLSRQVEDLNQALALLGTKPLKLLVLGFSLPDKLLEAGASDLLSGYWRLSLTKAVAARQVSEMLWGRPGDEAFLAGLLEDLGMLVMMRELGEPYQIFLRRIAESDADLCQLERDSLGFDHVELSAKLLTQWKLPEKLTTAISRPGPLPELAKLSGDEAYLSQVASLADLIAQLVVQRRLRVLPDLIEGGKRFIGLTKSQLTELIATLEERVESLAEVLSLALPSGTNYAEVLCIAHERLTLVAESTASTLLAQQEHEASTEQRLLDETAELAAAARQLASEPARDQGLPDAARQDAPLATSSQKRSQPLLTKNSVHRQKLRAELVQRLAITAAVCRQNRTELSLLVVGSQTRDDSGDSIESFPETAQFQSLQDAGPGIDHPHAETWLLCDSQFAVLLPDCDRGEAIRQAQQLLRRLGAQSAAKAEPDSSTPKVWSVGSATVPMVSKNFDPRSLLDSAERCLYGAKAGGGTTVKSLEIC